MASRSTGPGVSRHHERRHRLQSSHITQPTIETERLFREGSPFAPASREEIVGIDHVLCQVDRILAWLQNSDLFAGHQARLEPGVLFEGPPGTGKTLVCRYLAGASGALFVDVRDIAPTGELSAADVRELFAQARQAHQKSGRPILLFWDEFDVSSSSPGPMQPPRRSATATRLMVELDGVQGKNDGLLLVVCTNHAEAIDRALLRPGRIGARIRFYPPDREGKATLLAHYLAGRPTSGPIDCDALSSLFLEQQSAAGVEEAVADTWRLAVERSLNGHQEPQLTQNDLRDTLLKRILGPPPANVRSDKKALLRTAVHEIGHALVALACGFSVNLVTVRAGRDSAGLTMTDQQPCPYGLNAAQGQLRVAYGGMLDEQLAGFDNGLGNDADTAAATRLAVSLVDQNGVGDRAMRFNPTGLGPGPMRMHQSSEYLLQRLDQDALDLLEDAYHSAEQILQGIGSDTVRRLAQLLVERQTLFGDDLAELVRATADQHAGDGRE